MRIVYNYCKQGDIQICSLACDHKTKSVHLNLNKLQLYNLQYYTVIEPVSMQYIKTDLIFRKKVNCLVYTNSFLDVVLQVCHQSLHLFAMNKPLLII